MIIRIKKLTLYLSAIVLALFAIVVFAADLSSDDFECNGYNCGTGWNGAWSTAGGCTIDSGQNPFGTYHLRGRSSCDAQRFFDSTGADEVTITFQAKARSLEGSETCSWQYYDGSSWNTLLTIANGGDSNSYAEYAYNVSGYGFDTAAGFRMLTGSAQAGDYCYTDNIDIDKFTSESLPTINVESPTQTFTALVSDTYQMVCNFTSNTGDTSVVMTPQMFTSSWIDIPTSAIEDLQANESSYTCGSVSAGVSCLNTWTITSREDQSNQLYRCEASYDSSTVSSSQLEVDIIDSTSDFSILMDDEYSSGQTNVNIQMSSPLTSTIHNLTLFEADGTVMCSEQISSPSVAYTSFSASCDIVLTEQTGAYAVLHSNSQESINTTETFDIVSSIKDQTQLKIKKVYFSEQVLQGGSTEIFVLLEKNDTLTVTEASVLITFPNNKTRKLSMDQTVNQNEYRSFITETFDTGSVEFDIWIEADGFYDDYSNYYTVAEYNVDFVDVVEKVGHVLGVESQTPTLDVLGTYYEVGDAAKVIAQLSDQGLPVNNGSCVVSIWYPSNTLLTKSAMSHITGSDGLYTYNLIAPATVGVYPVSVACDYLTEDTKYLVMGAEYKYGVSLGSPTDLWYDDEVYSELLTENIGGEERVDVNLSYIGINETEFNVSSNVFLMWQGYTTISSAEADVSWFNWVDNIWSPSISKLSSEALEESFYLPYGLNKTEYVSNGTVKVKINGSTSGNTEEINLYTQDFEDTPQTLADDGFYETYVETDEVIAEMTNEITASAPLRGSSSFVAYGDDAPFDFELSYVIFHLNSTNYTNISVSYVRSVVGSESGDTYTVEVSSNGGGAWSELESWTGNIGTSEESYNLNSSYDNNSQIQLRFTYDANYLDDALRIDDVNMTGHKLVSKSIFTDLIVLDLVTAVGQVNAVSGGSELNVKDRVAGIESELVDLGEGVDYLTTDRIFIQYAVPDIIELNARDIMLPIHLENPLDQSDLIDNAECVLTLSGPINSTSYGPPIFQEVNMTNAGAGNYFVIVNNSLFVEEGQYHIETNCQRGSDFSYEIEDFFLEEDINKLVGEQADQLSEILNLTRNINATLSQLWERFQRTNESVILQENLIVDTLNSTSKITLNYTIVVPMKSGFSESDYLPGYIEYYLLDEDDMCVSQHDYRSGMPHCDPIRVDFIGKPNALTNFTVEIEPALLPGNYTVWREVQIDPPVNGEPVWIKYGSEVIGGIEVLEGRDKADFSLIYMKEGVNQIVILTLIISLSLLFFALKRAREEEKT